MDLQLKDKKALVAGSSRGLGYALARGLGFEGARITLNGRNPKNLEIAAGSLAKECGVDVYAAEGDVSEPALAEKVVNQAAEFMGGLDLLVTNSGGPSSGKFENIDDDQWQNGIQFVFMSHVRLIKAALPYLRESKSESVYSKERDLIRSKIDGLLARLEEMTEKQ